MASRVRVDKRLDHDWGARSVEPWLVYVASISKERQRRVAVHAADLALGQWIEDSAARGVILWARGAVIRLHLRDPKTALADLREAAHIAPAWLRSLAMEDARRCADEAERSRKRKPSVDPAPSFTGTTPDHPAVRTPAALQSVNDGPPPLWPLLYRLISSPDE